MLKQILELLKVSENEWNIALRSDRTVKPSWPGPVPGNFQANILASFIDHTLLKPDAINLQIDHLCSEAITYGFASVCVNSCHVARCAEALRHGPISVCGVVGFPLGAMVTSAKVYETRAVIEDGGHEVDMVMNIGKFKSGDFDFVRNDIAAVCAAAGHFPVKVIIETGLLIENEIVAASAIAVLAGAAFVKTSTGFGNGGATETHVSLMRQVVGPNFGVKASGGIRDTATALKMIVAGANRIGTSNGVAIVTEKPLYSPGALHTPNY